MYCNALSSFAATMLLYGDDQMIRVESEKLKSDRIYGIFKISTLRLYFRNKFAYEIATRDFILFKITFFSYQKLITLSNSFEIFKFKGGLVNFNKVAHSNYFSCYFFSFPI